MEKFARVDNKTRSKKKKKQAQSKREENSKSVRVKQKQNQQFSNNSQKFYSVEIVLKLISSLNFFL